MILYNISNVQQYISNVQQYIIHVVKKYYILLRYKDSTTSSSSYSGIILNYVCMPGTHF